MDSSDVEILERETPYRRFFRMDVMKLRHKLFRGGWTDIMEREMFIRRPAVAVLPYDPVSDTVVLIEQFRLGAHLTDLPAWQIEVVAGLVEDGEDYDSVARRECVEEIGRAPLAIRRITQYLSSPGGTNEVVVCYVAHINSDGVAGIHGLPHEHEDIRAFVVPFAEAVAMLERGEISNALAIIALQWLMLHHDEVRDAWADTDG